MPYLMMDDNFADHPKIDGLSDGAFRLHVAAMCYAAKHLTDGYVPPERVSRLIPKYKASYATELIKAGVWVQHDTGHRIHDYLDWNKPRTWWEQYRTAEKERKREYRDRKKREREQDGQGDGDQ
jgi:hypothetical protein